MEINEIRRILSDWAGTKPIIKKVYIFGSRAKGTNRIDSDLDVAVELDLIEVPAGDDSGGIATWMFESIEWKKEINNIISYEVQLEHFQGKSTQIISKDLSEASVLVYDKYEN